MCPPRCGRRIVTWLDRKGTTRGGAHGSAASRVLRGRAAKPPGEERGRRSSRQHLYLIRMDISDIFHRRLAAAFANSANLVGVVPAIHRWKNVLLKAGEQTTRQLVQFSMVTRVPIGVYGQTLAAEASGSSTQPRLCGVPKEARLKAWIASPPLK